MIAAAPTTKTLSIWVRGWPVRDSEAKMASGQSSASADRWFVAVSYTVNQRIRMDTSVCPWLVGKPRKVLATLRFQGIPGQAKDYEKLTKHAIAAAYQIDKRSVTIKSVTSEPGEPGCWIDLVEVG